MAAPGGRGGARGQAPAPGGELAPRRAKAPGPWKWPGLGSNPALPSVSGSSYFPSAGLSFFIPKVGVAFRPALGDRGSPAPPAAGPQLVVAKLRQWLQTTVLLSPQFCGRTRRAGLVRRGSAGVCHAAAVRRAAAPPEAPGGRSPLQAACLGVSPLRHPPLAGPQSSRHCVWGLPKVHGGPCQPS